MAKGEDAKPKLSKSEARKQRQAEKEARRKRPATAVDPSGQKRPVPGPPVAATENATIVFRLSLIDHGGPWSFAGLSEADTKLIASFCKQIETLRPGELKNLPGSKEIPWESMIPEAQKRARQIKLAHFDGLLELRLGGKQRLFGLLDGHCFYPVWWDPEHQICPAPKKNT